MIDEKNICKLLSSILPQGRSNGWFESDAEIIQVNGGQCLFTTDEFCAEDLFREDDPYRLGANIAIGAISDILACGGDPLFYAHALTVNSSWDMPFLTKFGEGIKAVLDEAGAKFIGGDCGCSPVWRCTVSVIGSCKDQPITRLGARCGDSVYISGPIGIGNLEAALRLYGEASFPTPIQNQFSLRRRESAIMKKHASCCIDTSDGVCAALNTLADLNGCGYELADLPYASSGLRFCQAASLPKTLLFLGECGEYELLFSVRSEHEEAFLAEAKKSGSTFYRLGKMTAKNRVLREQDKIINLESWRMQARDFETPQCYLQALGRWLMEQLSRRGGGS